MRTFEFVNNVGGQVCGESFFMFKQGADGFWIGKYESEDCFRVVVFKGLVEFFSYVKA